MATRNPLTLAAKRKRALERQTARRNAKRREWLRLHPRCAICPNPLRIVNRVTCSQKCSQTYWNWFKRKSQAKPVKDRACRKCGGPIDKSFRFGTLFCNKRCTNNYGAAQRRRERNMQHDHEAERLAA